MTKKQVQNLIYNCVGWMKITKVKEISEEEWKRTFFCSDVIVLLIMTMLYEYCISCSAFLFFTGPAGVGKTQWCLHISASVVATGIYKGTNASAIYIDTESVARPER